MSPMIAVRRILSPLSSISLQRLPLVWTVLAFSASYDGHAGNELHHVSSREGYRFVVKPTGAATGRNPKLAG